MITRRLSPDELEVAIELLGDGALVAVPTETVYGLAARADRPDALAAIFTAKGRPAGHPLILHLASADDLGRWAVADERATALAEAFWPGPFTMVLPRTDLVDDTVTGGRDTVGIRVPDHDLTRRLIERGGTALAAPSANRFGAVSPTEADHVLTDLDGRIAAVLDGGASRVGVESTILELLPGRPPTLLRPGGISVVEIEGVLGATVVDGRTGESRAAGMLASHYAPTATVELVESGTSPPARDGDAWIVPSGTPRPDGVRAAQLPADGAGYAAGLYRALRDLDRLGPDRILVVAPTEGDLLDAVADRLAKAAAPR